MTEVISINFSSVYNKLCNNKLYLVITQCSWWCILTWTKWVITSFCIPCSVLWSFDWLLRRTGLSLLLHVEFIWNSVHIIAVVTIFLLLTCAGFFRIMLMLRIAIIWPYSHIFAAVTVLLLLTCAGSLRIMLMPPSAIISLYSHIFAVVIVFLLLKSGASFILLSMLLFAIISLHFHIIALVTGSLLMTCPRPLENGFLCLMSIVIVRCWSLLSQCFKRVLLLMFQTVLKGNRPALLYRW